MTTTPKGPEHPDLIAAGEAIDAAEAAYGEVLARVRATCRHVRVVERGGGSYGCDLGHHHARRLCCDCGYEETRYCDSSPSYPWTGTNTAEGVTTAKAGAALVLTTEFVKRIGFGGNASGYRPRADLPTPNPTRPSASGRDDGERAAEQREER